MSSENEAEESETVVLHPEAKTAEVEFRPFDDLADDYDPGPVRKVMAEDGLPTHVVEDTSGHIPALSCDTMVCMEDTRVFVNKDPYGSVRKSYEPDQVERLPNGKWYLKLRDSHQQLNPVRAEVTPLRERCRHYVRQVMPFEDNTDNKIHLRLCSARRTTEGTFMSLRDTAVYACSMREPRDIESEAQMEAFDLRKVKEGATRVAESIFGKEKVK